ncbi:VWA domain-containing protein [Pseudomarimonas arenosa]|uniref:VWA domain-containing protein n=1 Tax=Pseudomarimonas arenosa TaxID=2774145 RepID=A0AAW3ZFV7_9GAMM|nr:VWA domain-containing protein [Pseudomarimonas arenosa]MBD8525030.1 VWA domain-containing protein [Pseudomarimonas arenosa]
MSDWQALQLLRPWVLLVLPLVLWLSWRWQPRTEQSDWARWMDARLLHALGQRNEGAGLSSRLPRVLLALALTLMVLAASGPSWRTQALPTQVPDDALVIVLDLSAASRVADLSPSRLQRAQFKLADLLDRRRHGQTALVVYAGEAFTVAPLTDDAKTLKALLPSLSPDLMPVSGQRLDAALRLAGQLLDGGSGLGRILVFSNTASDAAVEQAKALYQRGVSVSAIGLGTLAGAPLIGSDGALALSEDGKLQTSTLDAGRLARLATAADGQYVDLAIDDSDLQRLGVLNSSAAARDSAKSQQHTEQRVDDGPWLALLALPLLALLFRRGWLLLAVCWLPLPPAQAAETAWWLRPEQQAHQHLERGDYEAARASDPNSEIAASAAYRAGDFAAAAELYQQFDSARAHYNRGNALARSGQLQQAISAYDEALKQDPALQDAEHNRAVVQQALLEQQRSSGQQGESGQQSDESSSSSSESSQDPSNSADDPSDSDAQAGDRAGSEATDDSPQSSNEGDQSNAGQSSDEPRSDAAYSASAEQNQTTPLDEQQRQQLQQAQREAMERALQERAQADAGEPVDAMVENGPPADPAQLERAQSVEQWLRKVPDDPGALLKRKFALEHRRRVLEGEQQ